MCGCRSPRTLGRVAGSLPSRRTIMTTIELDDLKRVHRATWAAGDYAAVAEAIADTVASTHLLDRVGIEPGQEVLDVATGTGNVALRAAMAGADATALDLTPELFAPARRRAIELGVEVEWLEDGSFDRVLSAFGVQFAPRHEIAALELVRVCRPGGAIGLVNWTPEGQIGDLFRIMGRYLPPVPSYASPPALWGRVPGRRRSGCLTRRAPARTCKQESNRERKEPPRVDAVVGEERRQPQRNREPRGDAPVVADDEVPPESSERAEVAHALAPAGTGTRRWRRRTRTSANETTLRNAITPNRDSSSPGQSTTAPSAPQKQPKLVSRRPTANLIVFSGTRVSGPRASTPPATTSTSAAAAPPAARPSRPCALPNEITMKTTSRPSSRTPLNATVNAYQSSPAFSSRPAAAASAR